MVGFGRANARVARDREVAPAPTDMYYTVLLEVVGCATEPCIRELGVQSFTCQTVGSAT